VEDVQHQQNCMCSVEGQEARAPHLHTCHSYSSTLHPSQLPHHCATSEWSCSKLDSYFSYPFGVHHKYEGCGCCRSIASILLMSNPIPQVVASDFFLSLGHNNCQHVHNVHCTFATVRPQSRPMTHLQFKTQLCEALLQNWLGQREDGGDD
jgi:hypothetical protein